MHCRVLCLPPQEWMKSTCLAITVMATSICTTEQMTQRMPPLCPSTMQMMRQLSKSEMTVDDGSQTVVGEGVTACAVTSHFPQCTCSNLGQAWVSTNISQEGMRSCYLPDRQLVGLAGNSFVLLWVCPWSLLHWVCLL